MLFYNIFRDKSLESKFYRNTFSEFLNILKRFDYSKEWIKEFIDFVDSFSKKFFCRNNKEDKFYAVHYSGSNFSVFFSHIITYYGKSLFH